MNLLPAVMKACKTLLLRLLFPILLLGTFTPARAAYQEKGQFFEGPSGKLYYELVGSGNTTPLVLVNGGPGFDHTYLHTSPAWDSLAKNRRVVFYDQRGNGQSAALKPGQSCTLADQIDDLEALRAHLGFDKMDLLGSSWGGFLAMAYSARHADRVAHLVLVDSAAPKWTDTIFLFDQVFPETTEREAAGAFAREFGDKAAQDANIREYLSMIFYSPEHREAFLKQIGPAAYTKEVNEAVTRDLVRFDLNPEIRKFRFPALVITGRYDMNVAPLVAYRIHKEIPRLALRSVREKQPSAVHRGAGSIRAYAARISRFELGLIDTAFLRAIHGCLFYSFSKKMQCATPREEPAWDQGAQRGLPARKMRSPQQTARGRQRLLKL